MKHLAFVPLVLTLTACAPELRQSAAIYKPPSTSGLKAVRPYPTRENVCQVIGENELTANYLDHTATLIGCPDHELEAIADRLAEGAVRLDQIGDWVLLSVPD